MLGAYDVKYMSRTAAKGQILANFVVEFIDGVEGKGEGIVGVMTTSTSIISPKEVYTDGVANRK